MNDEIQKCLSLLDAGLENNSIKIEVNAEGGDEYAFGVPGEFAQVIVNVISNAKDVLLSRKITNPPTININSRVKDGCIIVDICDNAGGINEGIIDRIFEPYFTTKPDGQGGTGIGLYFSKMIIEGNMSGKMRVRNSEDGACFAISVPVAE